MLGFEHPSHMVTHPSTDESQCCLSLEINVDKHIEVLRSLIISDNLKVVMGAHLFSFRNHGFSLGL